MKKIIIASILTISFFTGNSQEFFEVNKGSIDFTSDASLEVIKAKSTKVEGLIKTDNRSFAFRAPMKSFEGFNSSLQQTHFNENYMESGKYPNTMFEGKIIEEVDLTKPGTYNVRGKGKFTCHGVDQERILKCTLIVTKDKIEVSSQFTVLLEDHNIKIPSVVSQKIAEEILVNVDFTLTPKK